MFKDYSHIHIIIYSYDDRQIVKSLTNLIWGGYYILPYNDYLNIAPLNNVCIFIDCVSNKQNKIDFNKILNNKDTILEYSDCQK